MFPLVVLVLALFAGAQAAADRKLLMGGVSQVRRSHGAPRPDLVSNFVTNSYGYVLRT